MELPQQVSCRARSRTLGFPSSSITCDIKATEMESQTPSPEHSVPRALGGCCKGQRRLSDAATVLSPVVKVDNEVRRGWAAPRRPLETTIGWEYPLDKHEERKNLMFTSWESWASFLTSGDLGVFICKKEFMPALQSCCGLP